MSNDDIFNIIIELRELRKDLYEFKEANARHVGMIEEWMSSTKDFRNELCLKFKEINERFGTVKCDGLQTKHNSLVREVKAIWGVVTLMLAGFIHSFFKK